MLSQKVSCYSFAVMTIHSVINVLEDAPIAPDPSASVLAIETRLI